MTNLRSLFLLVPMFLFAACGSEAGAAGKQTEQITNAAGSVTELLKSITDGKTAEAAKTELGNLTGKLSGALNALKTAGESAGGEAKDALGGLAKKAMDALSPEVTKSLQGITAQITRLMGNQEVKAAIGPALEKLAGILPK